VNVEEAQENKDGHRHQAGNRALLARRNHGIPSRFPSPTFNLENLFGLSFCHISVEVARHCPFSLPCSRFDSTSVWYGLQGDGLIIRL
jgi:hypothetical protein